MVTYARITFPLRTISLFSLYIILNAVLFARDNCARNYVYKIIEANVYSNPSLPDNLLSHFTRNYNYQNFPKYKQYIKHVKGWIITADICIVFLAGCLVFGFMANYPYKTICLSMLHFVGIVLCTHMVINTASINYLICGVVFGIFLPTLIEVYNIVNLFAFMKDFYIPRKV